MPDQIFRPERHAPGHHRSKLRRQIVADVDPLGFHRADQGESLIHGHPTALPDGLSAIRAGIAMVFQHFKLVKNFTVLKNVIPGAKNGPLPGHSLRPARYSLTALAREYGLEVYANALVEDLSPGHQQRVEILKAL